MTDRMRLKFEKNLDRLNEDLVEMGKLVTEAIEKAVQALVTKDVDLARQVYEGDQVINSLDTKIENQALNLLLIEKPVASDFRFVTTALKMTTDLERIGDQASDISYLIKKLNKRSYKKSDLGSIVEMSKIVVGMVEDVLQAYLTGDLELVHDILTRDDKVDEYFAKVRKEVIKDVKEDVSTTKNSLDLFLIAKYLERIGDHAENLAENVHFSITAEPLE